MMNTCTYPPNAVDIILNTGSTLIKSDNAIVHITSPLTFPNMVNVQQSYLLLRTKDWSSEEQWCHNRHIQDIFPYSHTDASLWLQRDGQRNE